MRRINKHTFKLAVSGLLGFGMLMYVTGGGKSTLETVTPQKPLTEEQCDSIEHEVELTPEMYDTSRRETGQ